MNLFTKYNIVIVDINCKYSFKITILWNVLCNPYGAVFQKWGCRTHYLVRQPHVSNENVILGFRPNITILLKKYLYRFFYPCGFIYHIGTNRRTFPSCYLKRSVIGNIGIHRHLVLVCIQELLEFPPLCHFHAKLHFFVCEF